MSDQPSFRHELKYPITQADYLALRARLSAVMQRDAHAGPDGSYLIRSIYFDNYADDALREKINGYARREKFRIRTYNDDHSLILLEKKQKVNNLCKKADQIISPDLCRALLCTHRTSEQDDLCIHAPPLVQELYYRQKSRLLRPRVLVSYRREAWVFAPGNVRITFDRDIRSSLFQQDLFDSPPRDIPVADPSAGIILEVKYDAFLPTVIAQLLQCDTLRQSAFSKYGICRRFG